MRFRRYKRNLKASVEDVSLYVWGIQVQLRNSWMYPSEFWELLRRLLVKSLVDSVGRSALRLGQQRPIVSGMKLVLLCVFEPQPVWYFEFLSFWTL